MWDFDNSDLFNLLTDDMVELNSKEFKNTLNEKGLEVEVLEIEPYTPPYLGQIELKLNHFIAGLDTFWLGLEPSYIISYDKVKVDAKVFSSVKKLCQKNGLEEHIHQLASLVKFGYCFYTLAELTQQKFEATDGYKELKKLFEVFMQKAHSRQVKFQLDNKTIAFKSHLINKLITNAIGDLIYKNIKSGWFNTIEEESFNKSELHVKYRNLTVFNIVCYLYREVGFVKLNSKGKVSISKKVGSLIAELLEIGKINIMASKKYSDKSAYTSLEEYLISSHFKQAIKTHPILERFLYEGPYSDEEYELISDKECEIGQLEVQRLMGKAQKRGSSKKTIVIEN